MSTLPTDRRVELLSQSPGGRTVLAEFADFNPDEWEPYATSRHGSKNPAGTTRYRHVNNHRRTRDTLPPGYVVHGKRVMHEDDIPHVSVPAINPAEGPDEYASGDPLRVLRAAAGTGPESSASSQRLARLALLGMIMLHEKKMHPEVKTVVRQAERFADNPTETFDPGHLKTITNPVEGTPGYGHVFQAMAVGNTSPGARLYQVAAARSGDFYRGTPDIQASSARHADVIRSVYYQGKGVEIPANRTVMHLARTAYADSDRNAMLALADALEETGHAPQVVLDTLRNPHSVVRGNWVLDAILGKR